MQNLAWMFHRLMILFFFFQEGHSADDCWCRSNLKDRSIDTIIIGGCGPNAKYGIKYDRPNILTLNNDPEADPDILCDAFKVESPQLDWLFKQYGEKIDRLVFEHMGGASLIDIPTTQEIPLWYQSDPISTDSPTNNHVTIPVLNNHPDYLIESQYALDQQLTLQELIPIFKLFNSEDERKQRPLFMELINKYVSLIAPGGTLKWQSWIMSASSYSLYARYAGDILTNNKLFLENVLGLQDVKGVVLYEEINFKDHTPLNEFKDKDLELIDSQEKSKFYFSIKGNK